MMTKVMLAFYMKSSTPKRIPEMLHRYAVRKQLSKGNGPESLGFKGADLYLRVPFLSTIIAFGGTRQIAIMAPANARLTLRLDRAKEKICGVAEFPVRLSRNPAQYPQEHRGGAASLAGRS